MSDKRWRLVADIGGTNSRFGLADNTTGELYAVKRYSVSQHKAFPDVLIHFLADVTALGGWQRIPEAVCLAIASPTGGDIIRLTNSPWTIDGKEISTLLGNTRVEIINDFVAVGHGISTLNPTDWQQIGGGDPVLQYPISILGPGTGLGVCTLIPNGNDYHIIGGEGGHVDFAPVDAQELAVFKILNGRFGRVSIERVLSGAGILNIYEALSQSANQPVTHSSPAEVTDAALQGKEALCVDSLEMFCRVLGSVAGNLALTLGARGGIYIAGGIVPRFIDFFQKSDFRHRFESKGRFRYYLTGIPVRVITKSDLGLHGAIQKLNQLGL